ncbi:MAG TPA: GNAT family N-acetyltransferase [Methylotenera sp.]|nr:GNAT family N-acetyltransferase [Methylotenera sp.]
MRQILSNLQVIQVSWATHAAQLMAVREPVFIVEQEVEPDFEWDDIDAVAIHLLAHVDNQPVGCARIIKHQKIGRMAVLKAWRGLGIGQALLLEAIAICQMHGSKTINLTAQTHAISFYKQAGFIETSGVYQDANIPHVDMQLIL